MIAQPIFDKIKEIAGNLKYVPTKLLYTNNLVAIGLAVLVGGAGIGLAGTKGWKKNISVMANFAAPAMLAVVAASVLNPVSIYGGKKFGATTINQGYLPGQGDTGKLPAGAVAAYGVQTPAVTKVAGQYIEASSPRDASLPAIGTVGSNVGPVGNLTGQTDSITAPGLYGAPYQYAKPLFYSGNVIGKSSIYIRDHGAVEFTGGN